jgi:hypothetical protein
VIHLTSKMEIRGTIYDGHPRLNVTGGVRNVSKVEKPGTFSNRQWLLAIIIICTSIWVTFGKALAQNASPDTLAITAHSTLSPLNEPNPGTKEPYLVIGMVDRENRPSYGSFDLDGQQAIDPAASNSITRQTEPAISSNTSKMIASGSLVLSSLSDPVPGFQNLTNLGVGPASSRQSIQRSPDPERTKGDSFLEHRSDEWSFLAENRMQDVLSNQCLGNNESYALEAEQKPLPLAQFKFGNSQLPVTLLTGAVSQ